jgi:hypothetical protein
MVLRPEGDVNPQLTCNHAATVGLFGVRIAGLFLSGEMPSPIVFTFSNWKKRAGGLPGFISIGPAGIAVEHILFGDVYFGMPANARKQTEWHRAAK